MRNFRLASTVESFDLSVIMTSLSKRLYNTDPYSEEYVIMCGTLTGILLAENPLTSSSLIVIVNNER